MKTDKNTVIGFVLLGILFMGFFWITSRQQQAVVMEQKRIEDSIAKVKAANPVRIDTVAMRLDSLRRDSIGKLQAAGKFDSAAIGTEELVSVENELMKVTFTNKGGQPKSIELKKYKSYDSTNVIMAGSGFDNLSYNINTSSSQSATGTGTLFFKAAPIVKNADSSQTISFNIATRDGESIIHQYVIKPNNYMVDFNIMLNGADRLLTQNALNINWQVRAGRHQSDVTYERTQSRLCFVEEDEYDFEHAASGVSKSFEKPVRWVSLKQQFFNSTLISKSNFTAGEVTVVVPQDSTGTVGSATANLKFLVPAGPSATVPLQLYYGPNEFNVLKQYNNKMESIVDLGSGVFSFVKYINRYIIMPVFDFIAKFIKNYGWVIAFLTLFIRLVTSPLTYTSYLSGAKMKVLRPELDVIKKKYGDDQQGFAVEQMKLFREAGVNPLGGCIPAVLQIPIFFALYSFFNSEIALRGQSFLWAKDLSSYDVIAKLPFSIPLGFGDHISLFTLTAVLTSFLISIYNMNMTPDQNNPMLKYMPYIFPFVLLFIFNRLPSALTWYYTVSNVITLILQFVIQNYIIDHDKILAKMHETRKKPKEKSKWQQRYQDMIESQKKVQELKQRTPPNRNLPGKK
jgi:YidC/Oxa1 family membrane protein insertase